MLLATHTRAASHNFAAALVLSDLTGTRGMVLHVHILVLCSLVNAT